MTVEPIRDKEKIKSMFYYLNGKDPKYGLLFKFGLNTGLRISDILPLKTQDVFNEKGEFKDHLILKEKKTGKEKKIKMNNALRNELKAFVLKDARTSDSYLFYNKKSGSHINVECFKGEKVNGHAPAVDVLFFSVAEKLGRNAIGVILTGMGQDGAKGLLEMRKRGARTIGQDRESSVVYGMPKVAYEIGAVEKQAALPEIAQHIHKMLCDD